MEFKERKTDSRKAEHRCAKPDRQLDVGEVRPEKFDAQCEQLIVRDDEGRWWTEVTRPTNVNTSTRTVGSGVCLRTTSRHPRRTRWITGRSLTRPSSFSRGARYGTSARPFRDPSRMNRRLRKRFQIARQPATGTVTVQTLWLRCWRLKGAKHSTRRKG